MHRRYFQHAHFIPIVGMGKRAAYLLVNGDAKAAPVTGTTLLRFTGLNAISTQLRGDPINTGLTRWRMAVKINKWTPSRKSRGIPRVSARFSLSMEMGRLTRDGTVEPLLRDQILRRERGQGNIHSPCSADHEEDWQLQHGASRRTSVSSPTKTPSSEPNARASKQPCARGGCCGRGAALHG